MPARQRIIMKRKNAHKLNLRVKQIEEQLQAAAQNGDSESKQLSDADKNKKEGRTES